MEIKHKYSPLQKKSKLPIISNSQIQIKLVVLLYLILKASFSASDHPVHFDYLKVCSASALIFTDTLVPKFMLGEGQHPIRSIFRELTCWGNEINPFI